MYIYIYVYREREGLSLSKITLTTFAKFGNRGMLASYDTYVRLTCVKFFANVHAISLDFLDVTYFPKLIDRDRFFLVRK